MVKYFNIIRELYLNKENRNILKSLLKYLNTDSKGGIVISFLEVKVEKWVGFCRVCFKKHRGAFTRCIVVGYTGVCNNCHIEHIIKYTDKCKAPSIHSTFGRGVYFRHSCKYGNFSGSSPMPILDEIKYLEKGTYKENIIDYINDGYKFKWELIK